MAYEQWHEAFCHVSLKNMRSEMYEDGGEILTTLKDFHCTACALSKFTKQILKSTEQRVKQSLDRLHFDLSEK
jgi:hypothetical protein